MWTTTLAVAQPYVPASPTASFISVMAWIGPLLLLIGAAAWAWPLVRSSVLHRVNSPRSRWDEYFHGDRVTSGVEEEQEQQPSEPQAPARVAALPPGVDESIFDE